MNQAKLGPYSRSEIHRRIFCNRTLNLRSLRAIGYDMDYTLIHYKVGEWEGRAFESLRGKLAERGWPVRRLGFDPAAYQRGLIIDRQLGNIIKANQFGYIKRASHGSAVLDFDTLRQAYADEKCFRGHGTRRKIQHQRRKNERRNRD